MSTYTFKSILNGSSKFKKDSGPYHMLEQADTIDPTQGPSGNIDSLLLIWHGGREIINLTLDTVIVDATATGGSSTTYSPTSNIDTVYDALNPLFPNGKSSSAGSGASVADYTAMLAVAFPLTGFKMIQVLSDTVNMGGAEGIYQIWPNGSRYQIAANKQ